MGLNRGKIDRANKVVFVASQSPFLSIINEVKAVAVNEF